MNPSGHRDKEHLLLYGTLIMCPADMGAAGVARRERNVRQALSNKGTWLKRVTQTQNPDPTPLCSRTGWADTLKGVTHAQMSNIARNMEQRFRSVGRIRTRGENNLAYYTDHEHVPTTYRLLQTHVCNNRMNMRNIARNITIEREKGGKKRKKKKNRISIATRPN